MGNVRVRPDNKRLFLDFRVAGQRFREQTLLEDSAINRKKLERVLQAIERDIAAGVYEHAKFFPTSRALPKAATSVAAQSLAIAAPQPGELGVSPSPTTPTLREFCQTWVTERAPEWRRSHQVVVHSTLNGRILPALGDKPVSAIQKAELMAFRAALTQLPGRAGRTGLSPKRVNNVMGLVRQILADAAERYGFTSPAANVKPLKVKRSEVKPFSLAEVQNILATVRPDYRAYLTVRFFTGMRTGEVHGLKWKYVDFERRLIYVRETFILGEDDDTKTEGSQRDIQMSQLVFDALQRQHEATGRTSPYVFCNREGNPLDNAAFNNRVWKPLLRHLGLEQRRPYQMRHTAATLWLAAGEAPEWIARQLGHTTTEMLFRVYSRYVPNLTRRDGSAIDRLLTNQFAHHQGPESGTKGGGAA